MSIPAFKLVEAGFSQPQVEALAEFMQTEAARRSDLMESEHRLDTRIGEVKSELKADIAEVKAELKSTSRLHNWMIGVVLAFQMAIFAKMFLMH